MPNSLPQALHDKHREQSTAEVTAEGMSVVIERLKQAGLPHDHVTRCPDYRDVDRGWTPGVVTLEVMKVR